MEYVTKNYRVAKKGYRAPFVAVHTSDQSMAVIVYQIKLLIWIAKDTLFQRILKDTSCIYVYLLTMNICNSCAESAEIRNFRIGPNVSKSLETRQISAN